MTAPLILIATGGTAGHVVPALAVADALRANGADVHFVGGDRAESELVPAAGYEFHQLNVGLAPAPLAAGGSAGGGDRRRRDRRRHRSGRAAAAASRVRRRRLRRRARRRWPPQCCACRW